MLNLLRPYYSNTYIIAVDAAVLVLMKGVVVTVIVLLLEDFNDKNHKNKKNIVYESHGHH